MLGTCKVVRSSTDADENGFNILEGSAAIGAALGLAYNGSRSYNGLGEL